MGRWLDALAALDEIAEPEKNMEIPHRDDCQNPRNPPSPGSPPGKNTQMAPVGYCQNPRNLAELSNPSKPPRYPLGYTRAELEAARRDAKRLGYGINRKLH